MTGRHSGDDNPTGLPQWLIIIVVLFLLGYLGYAMLVLGPEGGLPFAYIFGTLLGAYAGLNEFLRRRGGGDDPPPPGGGPA